MSDFMLCGIDYVVEILPICRDLKILYGDVCLSLWHEYLEMYVIYPLRFLTNFYMCVLRFIGDVTYISWIFVLFACFIALIEIGCYMYRHETKLKKRGLWCLQARNLDFEGGEVTWPSTRIKSLLTSNPRRQKTASIHGYFEPNGPLSN